MIKEEYPGPQYPGYDHVTHVTHVTQNVTRQQGVITEEEEEMVEDHSETSSVSRDRPIRGQYEMTEDQSEASRVSHDRPIRDHYEMTEDSLIPLQPLSSKQPVAIEAVQPRTVFIR